MQSTIADVLPRTLVFAALQAACFDRGQTSGLCRRRFASLRVNPAKVVDLFVLSLFACFCFVERDRIIWNDFDHVSPDHDNTL